VPRSMAMSLEMAPKRDEIMQSPGGWETVTAGLRRLETLHSSDLTNQAAQRFSLRLQDPMRVPCQWVDFKA
jgi:hypothetical protein